ncbi:MAG: pyruvate kinase [Longimicrobiales bacterium]
MVRNDSQRLARVTSELDEIVRRGVELEDVYGRQLEQLHPRQLEAGRNLLHYLALRERDLRDLQEDLAALGLSSLGRCEAHVMSSVCAARRAVQLLDGEDLGCPRGFLPRAEGHARLRRNTNALFGRKRRGSSVRIMVTMPLEAATDYALVRDMLKAGMNCARINCSQGAPADWERMVENIRRARAATGYACRIFMDLNGPKIRTGTLIPAPQVVRISPELDPRGRPTEAARVVLFPDHGDDPSLVKMRLPISEEAFAALRPGRVVAFEDTRGLPRSMVIDAVRADSARASCWEEAYIETGTPVEVQHARGRIAARGAFGRLTGKRPGIRLECGDRLVIHADPRAGEGARIDADGGVIRPAHVACRPPSVLERIEVGHEVVLDDGKFRGIARQARPDEVVVEITHAPPGGGLLRANKGINLPDTHAGLFGLTDRDREDLAFVVEHADAVNVSFVNHPDDVEDLLDELDAAGGQHLGLVLKIESLMGVRMLPGILLAAMEWPRVGVMIARGDLAAEVGWVRLAQAQEEILWASEAAHFPVVWATEVLNQLAKKGTPTRGEISDVVMAERAECVMLNKGPHITTAIHTLDTILRSMEDYQMKKTTLLPQLPLEPPDPEEVGRTIGERLGRWPSRTGDPS